jgi:hypothetical protein
VVRRPSPGMRQSYCAQCSIEGATERLARCRSTRTISCAHSRSVGQTSGFSASACRYTLVMGRIQPTGIAHHRVVLADNSSAASRRFDIRHSITDWSVSMVGRIREGYRPDPGAGSRPGCEVAHNVSSTLAREREIEDSRFDPLPSRRYSGPLSADTLGARCE